MGKIKFCSCTEMEGESEGREEAIIALMRQEHASWLEVGQNRKYTMPVLTDITPKNSILILLINSHEDHLYIS